MKPLSGASLRRTAKALHLELTDDELSRLLPMVQDLLAVGEELRHDQTAGVDGAKTRYPAAHQPG